jgi:repressor LexA
MAAHGVTVGREAELAAVEGFLGAVPDQPRAKTRSLFGGSSVYWLQLTSSGGLSTLLSNTCSQSTVEATVLTGRQQEIWDFLVDYVDRHGYPPTVREIGERVGLASPSTVHAHLANLERAGFLKRDPTKPRALELTGLRRAAARAPQAANAQALPLVGEIAAGGPLLAAENVEEYVDLPERLVGPADFLLRVKGESMIDAGILDGDLVVVRKSDTAVNGDIVVALAGDDESADEATVKRYFRESGRIRLQPENTALEPIYAKHVQILGKVVGVFRAL